MAYDPRFPGGSGIDAFNAGGYAAANADRWALSPESDAAWNDLLKSMLLRQAVQSGDLNLQQQQMYTDQMLQGAPPVTDTGTAAQGLDYAGGATGMRAPFPGEKQADYIKAKDKYDAEMRAAARKAAEPPKPVKEPPDKRYSEFLRAIAPKPNKLQPEKPIILPQDTREAIAKSFGYKSLEEALAKRPAATAAPEKAAPSAAPSPVAAKEDPYAMFPHQPWVDNMLKQGMSPDEIINKVVTPMPAITPAQKVARQQTFNYLDAKRNEQIVNAGPEPTAPITPPPQLHPPEFGAMLPPGVPVPVGGLSNAPQTPIAAAAPAGPTATSSMASLPAPPTTKPTGVSQIDTRRQQGWSDEQIIAEINSAASLTPEQKKQMIAAVSAK